MNEPPIHLALPPFTRAMKALSVALAAVWLAEALVGSSTRAGVTADPMGPFSYLVLIPERVVHGEVWRLVTHPFVHDPTGVQSLLMTTLSLWFFGGPMEARWGRRRLFAAMAVTSVVAALALLGVSAFFTPFWTHRAYGPEAATSMLAAAWGMSEGRRPMSFLGLFNLTGRQFTALLAVMLGVGFVLARSPASVLALLGLLLGAVIGNVPAAPAPRPRRESGPKLRVIKGGVDPRDLPN